LIAEGLQYVFQVITLSLVLGVALKIARWEREGKV
jgi:hypothetical protein